MKQTERERVYLVSNLPEDLDRFQHFEIQVGDFFDSNAVDALKVRKKGDVYHLVKKEANTVEERIEHVIYIKEGEFKALIGATIQSHKKTRYLIPLDGKTCELDLYQGRLDGYVRAEVEFENDEEMDDFKPPEWFAEEITGINHEIHEDLGLVTFEQIKERYAKKSIELKKIIYG